MYLYYLIKACYMSDIDLRYLNKVFYMSAIALYMDPTAQLWDVIRK